MITNAYYKRYTGLAFLLCSLLILHSCERKKENKLDAFRWLEGHWESVEGNYKSVETWAMTASESGDSVMIGIGFQIENGDTLFKEKLSMRAINDSIFYVAMPEGSLPTKFFVKKNDIRSFTAENRRHDFPQQIYYDSPGESTLNATVSGKIRDKFREIKFTWKRK